MRSKKFKSLFLIAAAAAAAYMLYPYLKPTGKYAYWEELIAKDPKPFWVSEKEYREKLRAGYCWRDRKFYTAEELQPKAMVGFAGRLLGEAEAYRTDQTTNQGGQAYTSANCERNKDACKVWFIEQGYTNDEWNKLFLLQKEPSDGRLLAQYPRKEIRQTSDLADYMRQHGNRGFTLDLRSSGNGSYIYGSDCCVILGKEEAEAALKGKNRITYLEGAAVFPENDIPEGTDIADYGVGNFYLQVRMIVPSLYQYPGKKTKGYHSDFSEILFMNNCGNVLWQPFYVK